MWNLSVEAGPSSDFGGPTVVKRIGRCMVLCVLILIVVGDFGVLFPRFIERRCSTDIAPLWVERDEQLEAVGWCRGAAAISGALRAWASSAFTLSARNVIICLAGGGWAAGVFGCGGNA